MKTIRYILTLMIAMLLTVADAWGAITPSTPSTDASGVYQIGTAEELWGFAQGVNNGTIAVSANAKLTCETSIDLGGSTNGSFPGIGSSSKVYTGTFDGNGKTIEGYYRTITATGQGFFNYTGANAKIKNLTLEGEMTANNPGSIYGVGTLIGISTSTTITDVASSVKMTLTNVSSGARIFGGLVGRATTSNFNRCRYKGLIDASGSTAFVDRIGGIIGDGSSTIENTLFDGEIKIGATTGIKTAGFAVQQNGAITINNSLFAGKLTFPSTATVDDNSGPFAGTKGSSIIVNNKSYYLADGIKKGESEASGYCTKGTPVGTTSWEDITNTLNNNAVVGETANWKIVEGLAYPIPMEYTIEAAGPYTITFDTKGGSAIEPIVGEYGSTVTAPADPTKTGYVFAGWDREIPTTMPGANITITALWTYIPVDGYYLIGTKEDFFNFATVVATNVSVNAKLLEDINLEEEAFSGFTGYKGTFDGNKKTISGYKRTFTSGSSSLGFFNTTDGAAIKDFTLEGEEIYNINSACYAIGSVIGMSTNTTVEGVTSKVKMTFGANCPSGTGGIRVVGGLVGRITGGSINKCRYKGTIDLSANSGICDRFGGIVGDLGAASTISNCLFDGEIKAAATANLTMGGILGARNGQTPTIQHCLFNGKMTFPAGANVSTCGPISGGTGVTASDSYYDMTGFTVGGVKQAKTAVQQSSSIERTTQSWSDIQIALGESNWVMTAEQNYPIPGEGEAHVHNYTNGFCLCGAYEPAEPTAGVYQIDNAGKLFWFTQQISNGEIAASSNATLTTAIDLENREFPGIGAFISTSDYSKAYSGIFDGGGFTISGYNRKVTSGNQQGFFNYAKGATIKNFKLEGTMTDSGTGQQHGSVIGWADEGTLIEDVHSAVNVTFTQTASQSGGFAGRSTGTINRCSYSGTVSSSTAYDKIGGFIGCIYGGTLKNCLFDGTLNLSSNNAGLIAGGLAGAFIDSNEGKIQNSLSHGTVTIPNYASGKCGIVVGLVDRNSSLAMTLYTTTGATEGLTAAVGSVTSGKTLTGTAKDVTSETWENVAIMLNPYEGNKGYWSVQTGDGAKLYPVPMLVNGYSHTHVYKNGFCISEDNTYEPATQATDGRYEVSKAGQLWWLACQLNGKDSTLPKTTRIRLTADIDMEGDSHGQFPGICTLGKNGDTDDWEGTAFQGTFDGNNHTISNYNRTISVGTTRSGIINAAYNATIRNININGTVTVTVNGAEAVMIGTVVGSASGTSNVEDINSSVSLIVNNGNVRDFGGVAGALEDKTAKALTTMNRCRYSGTITLNDGTSDNRKAQNVGGLVGELRSAVIKNCLFDGTITAASGANYSSVGGVVGKVGTNDNSEMHRILSHGTITLNGYTADTNKSGIVVGSAEKTIYLYKNYHTTTNCTTGLSFIGPHIIDKKATASDEGATVGSIIKVDQLLGTSTDKTSNLSDLYSEAFRTTLGEPNWHEADATTDNAYIYPYKDDTHIHKYKNGFCTSGDGEYEKPSNIGNKYQIYNAGQLFWFATQFNGQKIAQDATVEIMRDLDMESDAYIYPGIGTQKYPFKGVFEGHNHKIGRYYRDVINAEHTGFINDAVGAKIQSFSIYGDINFNLATIKSFHGTVLGYGINETVDKVLVDTMLITDVFSFVNVNCMNANTRVLGGIAGRTSGGVHRSRYSGIIKGKGTVADTNEYYSESGRQIGGIVANAREKILISDCLFDGQIWVDCLEADTMRVSGILASNEKNSGVKITIKNCLFNGCLKLKHSYVQGTHGTNPKSTENGIIAGYWDSNLPKFVNNVYYLKTCDGMDEISIGEWEGKNQQTGSKVETTEIKEPAADATADEKKIWDSTTGQPNWNEIFKALDEYEEKYNDVTEQTDTIRNGNWIYTVQTTTEGGSTITTEEVTPGGHVCHHLNDDGTEAYDEFGYCTICGAARPLKKDKDGKYKLELVSDLASFRDMVNDGDINEGTVLNCKLTADIDFENFTGDFGEPIGNSNFNRYLYNFDGQGYSLLNVKITTDDQYVGFFGFAGDDSHDCEIHDLTITGSIEVPYKSTDNDDKPMYMGVVGKMYRGRIYNVHSELTMRNTNATRAMIGGIVGCCETSVGNDANGKPFAVIIDKCSYTGDCYANAAGNMGGIVGQASRYTSVTNCTFAGNVHHTYKGVNNQTNFSGIVGYNEEPTFQGVKNCLVAGVLNTDPDRTYSEYGVAGNHKNALCGEDKIITAITTNQMSDGGYTSRYSGNYAWNVYAGLVPTNSIVFPEYVDQSKFINGEICAIMNGRDDAPTDIQNGHPWRQILGYQKGSGKGGLGINDDGNIEAGPHTEGSPVQRVPLPGYKLEKIGEDSVKTSYRVIKDASNNYTADYYYFDDAGDTTPYPSDANSMKVKRIDYTRKAEYMGGYSSFCLPFDFTESMLPSSETKCYTYLDVSEDNVQFEIVKNFPISRGTPFVMKEEGIAQDWAPFIGNSGNPIINDAGTPVALSVSNPSTLVISNGALQSGTYKDGIYGVFNTMETGWGYWKLKSDGSKLVKTVGRQEAADKPADAPTDKPLSYCYPYRAYFKLPEIVLESQNGGEVKEYRAIFLEDDIEQVANEPAANGQRYNLMGQKVNAHAKGIIIENGRKYVKK